MRRITSTALLLVGLLGGGACSNVQDAATKVADRVQCGATEKLADRLPAADGLNAEQMTKGASIARNIGEVLGRLPGDRVPASVTDALDGAASQWKRPVRSSFAIGPASGSPAAMRSSPFRCWVTASTSTSGHSARARASSSAVRAWRKPFGRQNTTTPTLIRSPRSSAGTSRTTA